MTEFITLNYYFRCDSYDTELILSRGFMKNHKTNGNLGLAIYLTDLIENNLNGKSIILNVDLSDINGILFVKDIDELIYQYIQSPKLIELYEKDGLNSSLGNKYILPFIKDNNFNGLRIINDNLLILLNNKNIKFIRIYDEELKTIRVYSAPEETRYIIDDENKIFADHNDNKLIWG